MAAIPAAPTMADLGSLLCESSFTSSTPTDTTDSPDMSASSNCASLSPTPPTTVSPDSMSLASEQDIPKPDSIPAPSIEAVVTGNEPKELLEPEREPKPELDLEPQAESQPHEASRQSTVGADAIVVAEQPLPAEPPSTGRPRRSLNSLPVYNIARLAGTDVHGRRRSKGDTVLNKKRRTTLDAGLVTGADSSPNASISSPAKGGQPAPEQAGASDAKRSISILNTPKSGRITKKSVASPASAHLTRRATRLSGASVESLATKLSALSKRGKKAVEKGVRGLSRELRRLQDTNEFAHIDTRPVRYTVWSNGKYIEVNPSQPIPAPEPPRKKVKVDEKAAKEEKKTATEKQEPSAPVIKKPRTKKWLDKGLYAGQEPPANVFKGLTAQEKKKLAQAQDLIPTGKPNRVLPMPMYTGLRILLTERDFKLPFDVCSPLPPGQPKPAAYRTMTKNRFVGDAASYWKKTPHFEDSASKCVCTPVDGCGEDCQNRIMLYECDETNCSLGRAQCNNRAFQDLQERTKKGGRYRVGVEVFKTGDRGYGVRSNRCFEANQIIMEYTGEIITDEECERRMNEVYKDNECYYLMSFDQNMIIDATTGSIARFVNHSCSPNCRMIKWIVAGQPRMALFAGDRPLMTGEELTYDYNFDPFSAKNVQKCLCGSPNCRGVLGPKPKEVKPPKPAKEDKKKGRKRKGVKAVAKAATKVSMKGALKGSAKGAATKVAGKAKASAKAAPKSPTKRKLKDAFEFDGDDEETAKPVKKRKIIAATGVKRTLSSASLKAKGAAKGAAMGAAKGAAKGVGKIKRTMASVSVATKKKTLGLTVASKVTKAKAALKKTTAATVRKTTTTKKTPATTTTKKPTAAAPTPAAPVASRPLIQTKIVFPPRSPSLTIVAAGVTSAPQPASTTPTSAVAPTGELSTPAPSASNPGSKTSSRKVTPSRKVMEARGLLDVGASPALERLVKTAAAASAAVAVAASAATTPGKENAGSGEGGEVKKTTPRIKVVSKGGLAKV